LVTFDEGCGMENLRAFMLVTALKENYNESDFTYVPSDVETNPDTAQAIVENGFLLLFKKAEDRDKAIPLLKATGSIKNYQAHDYTPPKEEPKQEQPKPEPQAAKPAAKAPAPAKSAAPAQSGQQGTSHPKESLISVNLSKLDQLMAVVGEIVISESMMTSSPDLKGLNLDSFTKSARQLRKLTDELQDVSMSLRMVPVSATFQKMNRIVRDMSKKLNKQVKLTLIGEDTEVDKTIVDNIGDPIMHMVRNSVWISYVP
jgi:two-component system chemotaxis sensor kinase CheA